MSSVRNLVGQDVWVETPPARLAEAPTHQNVRTDTLYDAEGNAIEQVDPNGIVTHFAYDRQGRLTDVYENYRPGLAATARVNVHTEYIYDASGNRTAIRSANAVLAETQDVTSFTYDALGRQVSERDALGNTSTSTYDILGQRATSTAPDGTTTGYAYDGLGRQVGVDYPDPDVDHPDLAADVSFAYDARGQRVRMTDGLGTTTWTYDDLGRATEILDPFGKTVSYGYDGHSNRTRLSYPDGKAVNYAYDGLDRLESVTDWNNGVTGYTYTAIGQLDSVTRPDGVTSAYAYDPAGRLASIEHRRGEALLSSFAYSYDPSGNRSGVAERVRGLAEVELPAGWTPPAQFSAGEQGLQSIALGWPEEAGASGYRLERSTNGANWITLAELDAAAQYYLDDGLARHTQYWYRLTAQGDGGGTPATLATATGYAAAAAP